jgi:hypothetical protein
MKLKITVVATGFDGRIGGPSSKVSGDNNYSQNRYIAEQEKQEVDKEKSKTKTSSLKAAQVEPAKKKEISDESEDEGELGIPAFIRKKMM